MLSYKILQNIRALVAIGSSGGQLPKRGACFGLFQMLALAGVAGLSSVTALAGGGDDAPDATVGGRFFIETRFAQYFFAHCDGKLNAPLEKGDAVMNKTLRGEKPLDGPFAGASMNCRACHLVNEFRHTAGIRSYADFGRRSPIPAREDGRTLTPRNSPPLVSAARPSNSRTVLHLDGQFPTMLDLVETTFTGRNFGWMPGEESIAIRHIAAVVRADDGKDAFAKDRTEGFSYRVVLAGTDPGISKKLRLPEQLRLDVDAATDRQIFDRVSELVAAYVESLKFHMDENGAFDRSPYDVFLRKNNIPRLPQPIHPGLLERESDEAYTRRLRDAIDKLSNPVWVDQTRDGHFFTHKQEYKFGPEELAGLKIFLAETAPKGTVGQAGNCAACHLAPSFTDFAFHNTGAAQDEYDGIHGRGAFAKLTIPDLDTRRKDYDSNLPPTAAHPKACGIFEDVPDLRHPGHTDLGVWNVFANPDIANPQGRLRLILAQPGADNSDAALLDRSIACFKTPSVRDLDHGAPYLHTGAKDSVEDVLDFYKDYSGKARKGLVRNGDTRLAKIFLTSNDVAPLVAFLRSLNEDYDD
jgi:cytochrome c peroxidase